MKIFFPEDKDKLCLIKAGEVVEFYGTIYTARDAAHQRLQEMLDNKSELPVDFSSSFIYYAGPTPTKPGKVIGSIGPTTSSRMDSYAKMMKELNVIGTIGKGPRDGACSSFYQDTHILFQKVILAQQQQFQALYHQIQMMKKLWNTMYLLW